jgi:heat shock protein HslJ
LTHRSIAALITLAVLAAACGDSSTAPSTVERLEGSWQLLAFENADGSVDAVANGDRYTATFASDGRVNLRADCNLCRGPFTTSGLQLSVGNMACTLAACPEGSKSEDYIRAVSEATSYLRHESALFVYHPGGRLRLEQD